MYDFDENSMIKLFKIAYTYVKDERLAEDIVQEVLLKAYEQRQQFRGEAQYDTYLIRMVINRSKDMLRSWAYRNIVLVNTFFPKLNGPSAEKQLLVREQEQQLAMQILALKPKYREVIYFYYYEEYSVAQMAQLLQIPENTIKTRLARARNKLKEMIEEEKL